VNRADLDEAAATLQSILSMLLGTVSGQSGMPQAELKMAVGSLSGGAEDLIAAGTVGTQLGNCCVTSA
jgi:hypothetical protein